MLPEGVVGMIELGSTQGQDSIQAVGSPTHASSLGAGIHHGFTGCFCNARSHMHALRTKRGIAHTLGIGAEVVNRLFWHAAA